MNNEETGVIDPTKSTRPMNMNEKTQHIKSELKEFLKPDNVSKISNSVYRTD